MLENDVGVGTWSGSVSVILSSSDVLMLEKIRDDWVNHSNWVLLGGGKEVDGVGDTGSGADDEEGSRVLEGKLTVSLGKEMELYGGEEIALVGSGSEEEDPGNSELEGSVL